MLLHKPHVVEGFGHCIINVGALDAGSQSDAIDGGIKGANEFSYPQHGLAREECGCHRGIGNGREPGSKVTDVLRINVKIIVHI